MAIAWNTEITNVNLLSKRADVSFTRTDSDNPLDVFSQAYQNTPIAGATPAETTAARTLLLDTIWAAWQQEIAKRANIATLITDLEQAANNNLNAREV